MLGTIFRTAAVKEKPRSVCGEINAAPDSGALITKGISFPYFWSFSVSNGARFSSGVIYFILETFPAILQASCFLSRLLI